MTEKLLLIRKASIKKPNHRKGANSAKFNNIFKDVNDHSDIQIFAFHANIRIRFPNSNIRFFHFIPLISVQFVFLVFKRRFIDPPGKVDNLNC